jgi:DNA mismatch endonuclease (patch repair protein)
VFDKNKRSEIMSLIKSSRNASTEQRLISVFNTYGVKGWRRKYKVYGKPDFVFHREKVAVFVDGCFWHGHDCRNTRPQQNEEFWQHKISRNMERDEDVTKHLENLGWKVLRIWECELKKKDIEKLLVRLESVGLCLLKLDGN